MYNKRLVTSLIEHEDRVALPIVCKMIDNDSLPRSMSFRLWKFRREKRRGRERERENRKGWEKRLFIDGIIRERSGRWPPYPEGGERNTGNQLAEERRHRATRYESESGS